MSNIATLTASMLRSFALMQLRRRAHICSLCVGCCVCLSGLQLDDLALAVETVKSTQKRMVEIQRRVAAVKSTVTGWRQKQITEAELAAAIKEAKLVQAQLQGAANAPR